MRYLAVSRGEYVGLAIEQIGTRLEYDESWTVEEIDSEEYERRLGKQRRSAERLKQFERDASDLKREETRKTRLVVARKLTTGERLTEAEAELLLSLPLGTLSRT